MFFRFSAETRKISATAMEARTKYGPRRRKQIEPMISAVTTATPVPAQTPHHGATCLNCIRIIVV